MQCTIKPYNVIDHAELNAVSVERAPVIGDPLEVESEMYLICDIYKQVNDNEHSVGVIPVVYKTEDKSINAENYLESLYVALRRMQDLSIIRIRTDTSHNSNGSYVREHWSR